MKEKVYTRDVTLLMAAGFFYICCSTSTAPIVAGYAESIGASSLWMGIISALITGSAVVCRPIIGGMLYGNVELQMFYPLLGVIGALCFVMYWPCKSVCGQNSGVHT